MSNKYFIEFNNLTNLDLNLYIKSRVTKPAFNIEYEALNIPGRETLYREKPSKDIEIPIHFNFVSKDKDSWEQTFRKIRKWLTLKQNKKLKFSDDLEYFYNVKKINIDTPERVLKRIGRFTVIFTCEPFLYLEEGQNLIELPGYLYNLNEESKPIYFITGNGFLDLKVNNKIIKVNVGGNLTIDTKLGLCFRKDGTINNIALNGFYSDLYLREGENTFEYNSSFKIMVLPNWRCR